MMERRLGVVLGLCCVLGAVAACQGSGDGGDGDDAQDDLPMAGKASAGASGLGTGGSPNPSSGGSSVAGASGGRSGAPSSAAGSGGSLGLAGSGAGRAGAASGGSGGGLIAECNPTTTPLVCLDESTIRGCVDGLEESVKCADVCGASFVGTCDRDEDLCLCEPRNVPCFDGAAAFCQCARLAGVDAQCTFDEVAVLYEGCANDDPAGTKDIMLCFESYITVISPDEAEIDCEGADMECFPEEP